MDQVDFRCAHFKLLVVEPEVVRAVAAQVLLVTAQIHVPQFPFLSKTIIIIIKRKKLPDFLEDVSLIIG